MAFCIRTQSPASDKNRNHQQNYDSRPLCHHASFESLAKIFFGASKPRNSSLSLSRVSLNFLKSALSCDNRIGSPIKPICKAQFLDAVSKSRNKRSSSFVRKTDTSFNVSK